MGHASASAFNDRVDQGAVSLDAALTWHLTSNHFPPLPLPLVPVAIEAIKLGREASELEDPDIWAETLDMPDGLLFRGGSTITVAEAIENLHLDPFLG